MRSLWGIALAATLAILLTPYTVQAIDLTRDDHPVSEAKPDQQTLNRLAAAVEKNPNDVTARCELGACYDKLGLPDLAREQYSQAVKVAPNSPHLWMIRVKQELKQGHTDIATHLIESAHDRFANDPEVLFWYGNLFAAKSRPDDANLAYQMALKQNSEVEGLRSAIAEVDLEKMRFGDALLMAEEEIKRHPDFSLAYKVKGFALMGLRRPDQAMAPLRIAYASFKTQPMVSRTYAHACIWCGLYQEGLEPALAFLDATSTLTSNDLGAKKMLRAILEQIPKTELEKELPGLNKIIQKAKPNAAYYFALGDTLDRLDLHDLAIDQYFAGLMMEPEFARGLFRLGKDLELSRRDYKAALVLYVHANKLAPDDPEIFDHLLRLNYRMQTRWNDLAWQLKDWMRPAIPSALDKQDKQQAIQTRGKTSDRPAAF
jgi:tetratricopeptide (TPR) repeat protein